MANAPFAANLFMASGNRMGVNIIIFIVTGIFSMLSQTVLVRELMMEIGGNEIIFSVFLSLWMLLTGLGAAAGRFFSGKHGTMRTALILITVMIMLAPVQFLGIRLLAFAFSPMAGLMANIPVIFIIALIILFPGCLVSGMLFPVNCSIAGEESRTRRVYLYECLGMVFGGIIFFSLVPFAGNFQILIFSAAACFVILFIASGKRVFTAAALLFIVLSIFSEKISFAVYSTRYSPDKLVATSDSRYGRLDITEYGGQENYYWSGALIASSNNHNYAQEIAGFVTLQHSAPSNILLVGGTLSGVLEEIAKDTRVKKIDQLEIEPGIASQNPSFGREAKARFILDDPVRFMRESSEKYDVILMDMPDPSTIQLNRFYTTEFFRLAKAHLSSDKGVFAVAVSKGENFMLPELAELNKTVYSTINSVFHSAIIVPAAKNIIISNNNGYITNSAAELTKRMTEYKKEGDWFNTALILNTCNSFRIDTMMQAVSGLDAGVNRNSDPQTYLAAISLWSKKLGSNISGMTVMLKENRTIVFSTGFFMMLVIAFVAGRFRRSGFGTAYGVFSVSLASFVLQMVLLYIFQMRFGIAYFAIAAFTVSFMAGLTTGFISGPKLKLGTKTLFLAAIVIILLFGLSADIDLSAAFYFITNILIACFAGVILSRFAGNSSDDSGISFYFPDMLGAAFGGIIAGAMIPLYGTLPCIYFIAALLSVNIILRTTYR